MTSLRAMSLKNSCGILQSDLFQPVYVILVKDRSQKAVLPVFAKNDRQDNRSIEKNLERETCAGSEQTLNCNGKQRLQLRDV